MRTFFKFFKTYRLSAGVALGSMLFELLVELLQPFFISKIIDNGIAKHDMSVVLTWGAVLAFGALTAFAAGIFSSFVASHASQSLGYDIREALYAKVQGMVMAAASAKARSSCSRLPGRFSRIRRFSYWTKRLAASIR
jgi:ATP-binding cassette subfamily B multidrug efflux pump